MTGVAGYRGTNPPQLFISSDKEEILNLDTLGTYSDPFDLKNTFVSWEYDLDRGGGVKAELTLINPGTQLEDMLFSMYAVLASQNIVVTEKDSLDPEQSRARLLKNVKDADTYYVKWGYLSPPDQGGQIDLDEDSRNALSHMHEFHLLDMAYNISVTQEKIYTLTLLNYWDISYKSSEMIHAPKSFTVDLFNTKGTMLRPASRVIEEMLLQMLMGAEGYVGFSTLSKSQTDAIDTNWNKVVQLATAQGGLALTRKAASLLRSGADWSEMQDNTTYDTRKNPVIQTGKNWIAIESIKKFYNSFGFDTHLFVKDGQGGSPNPFSQNTKTPSASQSDGRNPTELCPYVAMEAAALARLDTPYGPIAVSDDLIDYNTIYANGQPMSTHSTYVIIVNGKASQSVAEWEEILSSGRFWACPTTAVGALKAGAGDQLSLYYAWPEDGTDEFDGVKSYKLENAPATEAAIRQHLETFRARQNHELVQHGQGENIESQQAIMDHTGYKGNLPTPEELLMVTKYQRSLQHYTRLNTTHFLRDISILLNTLNQKYFTVIGDYLYAEKVELANVPEEHRDYVDSVFTKRHPAFKVDWKGGRGIIVLGNSEFFRELYSWKQTINSFNIQPDDNDKNTISLSVGWQQRSDNIIEELTWKMPRGSMFLNIRRSPIVQQDLYNIATRFENDDAYQDIVMMCMKKAMYMNADLSSVYIDKGRYNKEGKLVQAFDPTNPQIYAEQIVEMCLKQARLGLYVERDEKLGYGHAFARPSREIRIKSYTPTKASTAALIKQVENDLRFIIQNDFTDIFFPKATHDNATIRGAVSFASDNAHGLEVADLSGHVMDIEFFRYIAPSPLAVLQRKMSGDVGGDPQDDQTARSLLWSSKMSILNVFKKLLTNVQLEVLGIPEMDILQQEVMNRNVALWVHEPRVPGTYHWITGMYNIMGITHRIDNQGYKSSMRLVRKLPDSGEQMYKYTLLRQERLS